MKNNKGFTLVELLVVIAIIAVLSAIAIVNLNTARNKGNDASIKANLAALPAAGEVFYDDSTAKEYTGFCSATSIDGVIQNIDNAKGVGSFGCAADANRWVAWAPLQTGYHCIDSTGFQIASTTMVASGTSTWAGQFACQ